MNTGVAYFVGSIVVGLGATLFMDIWALLLTRAFGIPSANYCLVGRWLCHMPAGKFMHVSIANAPQKRGECTVGWIAHYVIGALYGWRSLALCRAAGLRSQLCCQR